MPWEDRRSHQAQCVRGDFLWEVAIELVKKGRGEPERREAQAEGIHVRGTRENMVSPMTSFCVDGARAKCMGRQTMRR